MTAMISSLVAHVTNPVYTFVLQKNNNNNNVRETWFEGGFDNLIQNVVISSNYQILINM